MALKNDPKTNFQENIPGKVRFQKNCVCGTKGGGGEYGLPGPPFVREPVYNLFIKICRRWAPFRSIRLLMFLCANDNSVRWYNLQLKVYFRTRAFAIALASLLITTILKLTMSWWQLWYCCCENGLLIKLNKHVLNFNTSQQAYM